MLDTMIGLAAAMEKHAPEMTKTVKISGPKTAKTPKQEDLHKELKDLRAEVEELRKEKTSE